jgi:RNA polymerase sigma-70 factor (ECF subfamily)
MEPTEVELIRACQAGSAEAFRRLVEMYERRVFGVAYSIVHDRELARDLAQEAFLRVYRAIGTFDLSRPFYTWLYHIVVNLSIDALRKERHVQPVDLRAAAGVAARGEAPSDTLQRRELQERVRRVLDQLPIPFRVALTLRDLRGFTAPEIAAMVGCSPVTVRWRIHEARKRFRAIWEGEAGAPPGAAPSPLPPEPAAPGSTDGPSAGPAPES